MKKIKTLIIVLLLSLNPVFSQVVDLGSLTNFVFFTSEGAIENTGASAITGDIGSDLGLVALPGATHNGNVHSHDSVTELAKFDLITLYQKLLCVPNKDSTRAHAFGGGEILTTGVYFIDTCGSLSGNITLNGQGDTNALFIIKFAGAFTVAANSTIILTNNARACNVFWMTEGNCLIGSSTIMVGTVISSSGTIAMGANGDLTGRLLTMDGAIDFGPSNAQIPDCNTTIVANCTDIPQVVNLGSLANFVFFTSSGHIANTGASVIKGDIGSDFGLITLPGATHIGNVNNQDAITAQAKFDLLKLYQQLICVAATDVSHTPSFGLGETLTPGVYSISAAGSLAADITLDAEGDTTALFIVKFGAAFAVGANSTVYLSNGARACNVFWIAGGAATIDQATVMVGTVISSSGEISMDASGNLTGRLFTIAGNIAFGPSNAQILTSNPTALVVCAGVGTVPPCNFIKTKSCSLFTIYTSLGNIENSPDSDIIGKVGTNSGAITGFGTPPMNGALHIADSLAAITKQDLSALYKQLSSLQPTNIGHAAAFGGGEAALYPGIYYTPGSGTVYGNLVLDGLGDSNSIFIFQFTGAFSAIASSSISLINGTRDCNVFWVVKGAITLGALSSMKGSFLSKNRGIVMEAGATLKGRILTGKGAISITTAESMVIPECGCHVPYPLPVDLLSLKGECVPNQIRLNWETASETNNDYFSIERSIDGINWTEIGKINGAGNSSSSRKYFLDDLNRYNEISYYQLKQHDFSGISRTFSPISVKNCIDGNDALSIYPNPAENAININFNGEVEQVINTTIVDLFGRNVYQSALYRSAINIEDFEEGIYFLQLLLKSGNITRKFIIAK
jgi:hypothetical protein